MRPLAILLCLLHLACAIDTNTTEHAIGASWYDVRAECQRLCSVQDSLRCFYTNEAWWWPECQADCTELADEAYASDCLDAAETWQRCEWAEQPWSCAGGWPYASPDQCGGERAAYEACGGGQ